METMTPSITMTAGQIDKAVANYRAMLEKYSKNFNSDVVQQVLGQPELADEEYEVFRRRVEMVSNLIVRTVKVNRARTPQEVIDATGRAQYTNRKVVDSMPKGEGDEVEVVLFKPKKDEYTRPGYISDEDLEKALDQRGLKAADPYSVSAVNEADPAFADTHPHGTHWKNAGGKWCCAAFDHWSDGGRRVGVDRSGGVWRGPWFFAGVRK